MEKGGQRLLPPARCFPLIFAPPALSSLEMPLEVSVRALLQRERQRMLDEMHDRSGRAIAQRDPAQLADQCGALVDAILDAPLGILVSPLEQTLYAVISSRTVAPRELSPDAIFARDAAGTRKFVRPSPRINAWQHLSLHYRYAQ